MFQISHWKSIKYNDILHHFNVRLETLWYLSTFISWLYLLEQMNAAQNWIWPESPSLTFKWEINKQQNSLENQEKSGIFWFA